MLKSMTGFGRAERNVGDKTFLVDIKSLNGKQFDLQLKMPSILKPSEFDIRRLLSEKLGRGTVDCTISLKDTGNAKPVTINVDLAKAYYQPLAELSAALNLDPSHILSTLVKLPEVITPSGDSLSEKDWTDFQQVLMAAIDDLNHHRLEEGKVLEEDLLTRIRNIQIQQDEVTRLEPLRQQKIRDNLTKLLEEPEESKGKKLSFVLQEIGREINTTGSKAYDSTIQKSVVMMKDELEKAKEQVLNVL